jgi:vacuolar-type H+-ATPase catalytic subunit A/Vma1
MKAAVGTQEADLIDRIAHALPPEVRADYYRELRHCRSLPENDEMLRVLRAMQFSVLLIHQAPERMAVQTERLKEIFREIMGALQEISKSSQTYQAQLDQRLAQLPQAIAEGIRAEAIIAGINESLRQQFVQSTIPDTGHALAVSAAQIKRSSTGFAQTAREIEGKRGRLRHRRTYDLRLGCADEPLI